MSGTLQVRLRIRRTNGWQEYTVELAQDAYVLDALEAAYKTDTSLLFRHACHHASCGSCGVRVNGRECLACITRVTDVTRPDKALRVEPLRNFPILADLVVDFGPFMHRLDAIDLPSIRGVDAGMVGEHGGQIENISLVDRSDDLPVLQSPNRLENCIECGLCISACPVAGSDPGYLGPAGLASAGRLSSEPRGRATGNILALVDNTHGVWRCHGVFECTQVCPAGVDPAREIMLLRRRLLVGQKTNDSDDGRKS